MIGFLKSASLKPTARSIARLGERCTPWVISWLRLLSGMGKLRKRPIEPISIIGA